MTIVFEEGYPPWDRFQARIKAAICRAAGAHDTVDDLLCDLRLCEMFLRHPEDSLGTLEESGSPVAKELRTALETHATEDNIRYDRICAANIVLASMDAIVNAAREDDS